jgi:hypothetical protein
MSARQWELSAMIHSGISRSFLSWRAKFGVQMTLYSNGLIVCRPPRTQNRVLINILVVGVKAQVEKLPLELFVQRVQALGAPKFMALEIYEQMECFASLGSSRSIQVLDVDVVDMREVSSNALWEPRNTWVITNSY